MEIPEIPTIAEIHRDFVKWKDYLTNIEQLLIESRKSSAVEKIRELFNYHVVPYDRENVRQRPHEFNPVDVHVGHVASNESRHISYSHDGVVIDHYIRPHGKYDAIIRDVVVIDGKVIVTK